MDDSKVFSPGEIAYVEAEGYRNATKGYWVKFKKADGSARVRSSFVRAVQMRRCQKHIEEYEQRLKHITTCARRFSSIGLPEQSRGDRSSSDPGDGHSSSSSSSSEDDASVAAQIQGLPTRARSARHVESYAEANTESDDSDAEEQESASRGTPATARTVKVRTPKRARYKHAPPGAPRIHRTKHFEVARNGLAAPTTLARVTKRWHYRNGREIFDFRDATNQCCFVDMNAPEYGPFRFMYIGNDNGAICVDKAFVRDVLLPRMQSFAASP